MPYVQIELMDKDLIVDDKMGSTTASSTGSFSVKGSGRDGLRGKPDPYIRVTYSYSGTYGKLKVVKLFKIVRRDKTSQMSYRSYINFGTINFSNLHCSAYVEFYKALRHYKLAAKSPLPYNTLYIRTNALIHAGTPYATTNVVRIPRKYEKYFTYATAKHEFAHTIRHSFDGTLAQFLGDVIRYAALTFSLQASPNPTPTPTLPLPYPPLPSPLRSPPPSPPFLLPGNEKIREFEEMRLQFLHHNTLMNHLYYGFLNCVQIIFGQHQPIFTTSSQPSKALLMMF